MIQPMMVKKIWLTWSISREMISSAEVSRIFARARPKNTAKNNTCNRLLVAKALTTEAGTIPSRNSTVCGRWPSPVFCATAVAPLASVAGSMWKPAPGCTTLPMTRPKTSAKVVTTSK